jgi:hypothetical protein
MTALLGKERKGKNICRQEENQKIRHMFKSRTIRWARNVARMGEIGDAYVALVENLG